MAVSINLDEKSPEELKRLLDSVKTSNLSVQDKDEWIQNVKKNYLLKLKQELRILMILVSGLLFIGYLLKKHLVCCSILLIPRQKPPFCVEISKLL